jgi:alanyl-tRNA synthetase
VAQDRRAAGKPYHPIPTKDNFWAMGDSGPCGPCSEIFYDHGDHIPGGPPGSPDEDGDRFVEIWNLVFMQYEQEENEIVRDLPKPSIDTGMGWSGSRPSCRASTTITTPTRSSADRASSELTQTAAEGAQKASHRVIADHLALGRLPGRGRRAAGNEGRGYVLRRIMRRAMRHAHLLGAKEPLMHRLVPALVAEMGAAYPELVRAQPLIEETLKLEETGFRRTLANGLRLLDEATGAMKPGDVLPGGVAFKLYDTFGFPYDLTEDALRAQGFGVDRGGFDSAMGEQKAQARAAWKGSGQKASEDIWFDIAEEHGSTEFTGYAGHEGEGVVLALVKDGARVERTEAGDKVVILTNQTPLLRRERRADRRHRTIGSDKGLRAEVTDTSKPLGRLHAHHARIAAGEVAVGDAVHLSVDGERRGRVRANHSATHLLTPRCDTGSAPM